MLLIGIIEYGYHFFIYKNCDKIVEIEFDETDEIKSNYEEQKV
jgi:hypothetical protein